MKSFLLILLLANLLLAIEQVPRRNTAVEKKKSDVVVESEQPKAQNSVRSNETSDKNIVQKKETRQDPFIDTNSNGVNDRREDDFQNIKTKRSKYRDLFDKQDTKRVEEKQRAKPTSSSKEKTTNSTEAKKERQ
jgi:hypothetical protein